MLPAEVSQLVVPYLRRKDLVALRSTCTQCYAQTHAHYWREVCIRTTAFSSLYRALRLYPDASCWPTYFVYTRRLRLVVNDPGVQCHDLRALFDHLVQVDRLEVEAQALTPEVHKMVLRVKGRVMAEEDSWIKLTLRRVQWQGGVKVPACVKQLAIATDDTQRLITSDQLRQVLARPGALHELVLYDHKFDYAGTWMQHVHLRAKQSTVRLRDGCRIHTVSLHDGSAVGGDLSSIRSLELLGYGNSIKRESLPSLRLTSLTYEMGWCFDNAAAALDEILAATHNTLTRLSVITWYKTLNMIPYRGDIQRVEFKPKHKLAPQFASSFSCSSPPTRRTAAN